ncbi:50S ribosomal protein L18 [Amedibacillus dolichus]|uniref:50S ribosomal protein L18 n=1 Tax=Amedibacillus dolichus TaxID=31971 RepID=UPI002E797868|nr:50S ribosomal protein L18 [Amedibacillus dolichus]MEE0383737.1 50S ribosomal protein L18 [Amedibacillus dolichus]
MLKKVSRNDDRLRRHLRVRTKISGTPECPRLNVFRSNSNIHAQIIDDVNGKTLVSASSVELKLENGGNVEAAKTVGTEVAKRALAANIENVVFDRGGYIYTGRVKALADAAREAGLKF